MPINDEKQPQFFDGQKPLLEDIQQILLYANKKAHDQNVDSTDYGVAVGLDININANDNTHINITAGRAYNQAGLPMVLTGDALDKPLVNYTSGTKNYIVAKSTTTEDTSVAHPVTGELNNTRLRYGLNPVVQLTPAVYPDINLGYVVARGLGISLTSPDIVQSTTYRDRVHIDRIGSGTPTPTNPHGLTEDDIIGASTQITRHRQLQHNTVILTGTDTSLKMTRVNNSTPGDSDYISVTDIELETFGYFDGVEYTQSQLDFTDIDNAAAWNTEGANNGTYYIYVDTNTNKVKKVREPATVPTTVLYSTIRKTDRELSALVDFRVFSSLITNNIRQSIQHDPTFFQTSDPIDGLPGWTQRSINDYLYLQLASNIIGARVGSTVVGPDSDGVLIFEKLGQVLTLIPQAGTNKLQFGIDTSKLGFEIITADFEPDETKNINETATLVNGLTTPFLVIFIGSAHSPVMKAGFRTGITSYDTAATPAYSNDGIVCIGFAASSDGSSLVVQSCISAGRGPLNVLAGQETWNYTRDQGYAVGGLEHSSGTDGQGECIGIFNLSSENVHYTLSDIQRLRVLELSFNSGTLSYLYNKAITDAKDVAGGTTPKVHRRAKGKFIIVKSNT